MIYLTNSFAFYFKMQLNQPLPRVKSSMTAVRHTQLEAAQKNGETAWQSFLRYLQFMEFKMGSGMTTSNALSYTKYFWFQRASLGKAIVRNNILRCCI